MAFRANVVLVSMILSTWCLAQPTPVGGEFQVNTYTSGRQGYAEVAKRANGDFVVIYSSQQDTIDTSSGSIQGQRYASNGSTIGSQFLVNTYTTSNQIESQVSGESDGDFTVVWSSYGSSGSDTSSFSIQGQRYNSDGSTSGSQFQINTTTSNYQTTPDVSVNDSGAFIVVWEDSTDDIDARLYDSSGSPIGNDFGVNTYTSSIQNQPSVAMNSLGSFIVVWGSNGCNSCTDTSFRSVQGRLYDSGGTPMGSDFQINTYTSSQQERPAVVATPGNDFIVVWDSIGSAGSDNDSRSVQAQRVSSTGSFLGSEFQVNSYTTGMQYQAAVDSDTFGNFIVVWTSAGSDGGDTDNFSVQAQAFQPNGTPVGSQFQVNTYSGINQDEPSLSINSSGDLVITWRSDGSSFGDDSQESVQGQRFGGPVPVELMNFNVQ